MLIYFEIHINKNTSKGYTIENLSNSNQKEIKSNLGFDVCQIDAENEIYTIVADFNYGIDVNESLNKVFDNVKISYFRKQKIDKLINNLYIAK